MADSSFDFWLSVVGKNKPETKEATRVQYAKSLARLTTLMKIENDPKALLSNEKEIVAYLNEKYKAPLTKKSYLNAIMVATCGLDSDKHVASRARLGEFRDDINNGYRERRETRVMNDKEKDSYVSLKDWDELIAKLEDEIANSDVPKSRGPLRKSSYDLLLEHFLVKLYRSYPLRLEFAGMKVLVGKTKIANARKDDDYKKTNWCLVTATGNGAGNSFEIHDHKTSAKIGPRYEIIDKDIVPLIRRMLKHSPNPDYLVVNSAGNPLSKTQLSKFLSATFMKYLGKQSSTQALRRSFLTEEFSDAKDKSEFWSKRMGHSAGVQQQLYVLDKPE